MKIALFTTSRTTIPPKRGIIAASADLTAKMADGFVEHGHDVTLFAPKGSHSKAKIVDLDVLPYSEAFPTTPSEVHQKIFPIWKQLFISELYARANEFDIIHLQTDPSYLGLPFAKFTKTPTVITVHGLVQHEEGSIFDYYREIPVIAISVKQQLSIPFPERTQVIYHGIDVASYPFVPTVSHESYLYFTGRLVAIKGVEQALETSEQLNKPLRISGLGEPSYVEKAIMPHLGHGRELLSLVEKESPEWYQRYAQAKALLFPLQWEEPFGLIMIESLVCGTPVIAFARGSVPEVIRDGVTGFIVNPSDSDIRGDFIIKQTGIEGIREAVKQLYSLSPEDYQTMRKNCRDDAEKRYSLDRMIKDYLNAYQSIITTN